MSILNMTNTTLLSAPLPKATLNMTVLLAPLLFAIGVALGTTITYDAAKWVSQNKRKEFWLYLISRYIVLPLFAFAICFIFSLSNAEAIGACLVGISESSLQPFPPLREIASG
jgi:predicted Na+-dependent transporter